VNYSWTGKAGCTASGPKPTGSGNFNQNIELGDVVDVGYLPMGLTDVYIRLESAADIDILLYDGTTAVVNSNGGLISGTHFVDTLHIYNMFVTFFCLLTRPPFPCRYQV
jgi:hypothetical protein